MSLRSPTLRVALLSLLGLAACGGNDVEKDPIVRPVRYEQVFSTGAARTRSFSGTAQAGLESRLSFKVGGTVQQVRVKIGDRIRAGQTIARLDATDYDLRVQDAEAALARSRAEFRQAASNYDRIQRLWENRNAARADLDAARAASEAAEAAVSSSVQKLALARMNMEYTTLTAPVDGAISDVRVEANENVQPGQVVAVLSSGRRAEVTATVPEALIGGIREGDSVTVRFDALSNRDFAATVTEVGVSATPGGATFPVTVRLNEETEAVRPGMAAEVSFRFGTPDGRERIYVPPAAVQEDRGGRYAFVVEPADPGFGVTHRRTVVAGEIGPDGLEIREGLSDGELLVTAGVTKIQDGMRVKLTPAAGSAP